MSQEVAKKSQSKWLADLFTFIAILAIGLIVVNQQPYLMQPFIQDIPILNTPVLTTWIIFGLFTLSFLMVDLTVIATIFWLLGILCFLTFSLFVSGIEFTKELLNYIPIKNQPNAIFALGLMLVVLGRFFSKPPLFVLLAILFLLVLLAVLGLTTYSIFFI